MTDRELLEAAAKAAGYEGVVTEYPSGYVEMSLTNHFKPDGSNIWNPLHIDNDAFRLAVTLGIQTTPYPIYTEPKHSVLARKCRLGEDDDGIGEPTTASIEWIELYGSDPCAATRRAIVRVAAALKIAAVYGPDNPPRLRKAGESLEEYRAAMGWPTKTANSEVSDDAKR